MTRHRQEFARPLSRLSLFPELATAFQQKVATIAINNTLRRPCPHCNAQISPEGMDRHLAFCAEES